MRKYHKVSYRELPAVVSKKIREKDFLRGFALEDGAVVLWVEGMLNGKKKELEFCPPEYRQLSRAERIAQLPPGNKIERPDLGLEVTENYYLEPETEVLCEQVEVVALGSKELIGSRSETFYLKYKNTLDQQVRLILAAHQFPSVYSAWSEEEKINYWVGKLYQLRRASGEFGASEDAAFDHELLEKMSEVDRDIAGILPGILKRLAALERENADDMVARFVARTGAKLNIERSG